MSVEISAAAVMKLRDQTGAGMMDCKKALMEAGGDAEKAIEILRQKGLKKSAEKQDRVAKEGIVLARVDEAKSFGAIVEVNCETDFVARNDDFIKFSNNILIQITDTKPANLDAFLSAKASFNPGKTIGDSLGELTSKIGEKIAVKRFSMVSSEKGVIADYVHPGNKLGVLVQLDIENFDKNLQPDSHNFARDLAMQVAAMNPGYINRTEVPGDVIEKEMAILREQGKNEGKPEKVLENIIKGRMEKFYQEVCLMEQIFVKDSGKSIKELIGDFSKKIGKKAAIHRFERYRLGD